MAQAIDAAKRAGLDITELHKGHRWGKITCDQCAVDLAIWSTPKNDDNHAQQIARFTAKHRH